MIGLKTYQKNIGELQKAFKQNYTDEQMKRLFDSVKDKRENQLVRAVDWLILNKVRLPFPGEVITAVNEEAQRDWRCQKNKEQIQAEELLAGKTYKGKMATESLALIRDVLCQKITVPELHQKMNEMDAVYPGCGWRTMIIGKNKQLTF